MSTTIIGDVHGYTKSYQKFLMKLPVDQRTVQLGDMGLGFAGVGLPAPGMPALGPSHKFFRGNHDSLAKCRQHPNYLGDYGYLEDDGIFWVSGAFSIDREWRVEGISWWADEQLSYEELGKATDLYLQCKPRFVLSHEAPAKASQTLLFGTMGPYFMAKQGCISSRTGQALEAMLMLHQPEKWIFGHYHVDKTFFAPGYSTEFTCVGGMRGGMEQPHTYELKTDQ